MFILLTLILFNPNIIRALSFSSCDGVVHLGIIEFTPIRRMLAHPLNKNRVAVNVNVKVKPAVPPTKIRVRLRATF